MWHVINNSHPNDVDFLARWEIKEVHTRYLLIYHDSIRVFLLPYILSDLLDDEVLGPTQVKWRLLISSIFDAMNFQHFSEMLEFS